LADTKVYVIETKSNRIHRKANLKT